MPINQFTYYQLFGVDRSEVIRIRGNQGSTAHPEVLRSKLQPSPFVAYNIIWNQFRFAALFRRQLRKTGSSHPLC